ncbi:2-oxoisovalerate dehydrogenase subunit beta [Striga asiatica]|uniref:2-oxoisovalerate dehydrogenase subunit beta n=1 Tax=Striga asiatica TaxID=4170 RepID=A0A5A7QYK1_STRAF|nr:2-oxoisovalerate dehydrogenase subunit beta [Striga asiatica]
MHPLATPASEAPKEIRNLLQKSQTLPSPLPTPRSLLPLQRLLISPPVRRSRRTGLQSSDHHPIGFQSLLISLIQEDITHDLQHNLYQPAYITVLPNIKR